MRMDDDQGEIAKIAAIFGEIFNAVNYDKNLKINGKEIEDAAIICLIENKMLKQAWSFGKLPNGISLHFRSGDDMISIQYRLKTGIFHASLPETLETSRRDLA